MCSFSAGFNLSHICFLCTVSTGNSFVPAFMLHKLKSAAYQGTQSQERERSQQGSGFTRAPSRSTPARWAGQVRGCSTVSPGKFTVMRQVQGKAQKATCWSGSGPVRLTRVRHSPLITGQCRGQARNSVQSSRVHSQAQAWLWLCWRPRAELK